MIITFPWPPSALRPNASSPGNWWNKSKAAKAYKGDCITVCRAAKIKQFKIDPLRPPHVTLSFMFCPPDKRKRDLDGMLSSVKQLIDAISEEIGIDDAWFELKLRRGLPIKHGQVQVQLTGGIA